MSKVFKLRRKSTGLFHMGGNTPYWSESGKSYDNRAPLTTLIKRWKNQHSYYNKEGFEDDYWKQRFPLPVELEIVEFELKLEECVAYQGTDLGGPMKDKIDLLVEQYPEVWKTRAEVFSWLRGCLRRGVWEKYPPKLIFKNQECGPPPEGYTGRAKSGAECALSGEWTGKSRLEVDHVDGHASLRSIEDITPFILHLMAEEGTMQLVSKEAHKIKSYAERMGISFEEAVLEKQVIAFKKLSVEQQKEVLTNEVKCETIAPNAKGREGQFREWLYSQKEGQNGQ